MTDHLAVTPPPRLVQSLFRGLIEKPPETLNRKPKLEILEDVGRRYGLTTKELRGETRARRTAWPRQEAMWLMSREGYGDSAIGHFLHRTSWTVTHGITAHRQRLLAQGWDGDILSPLSTSDEA